MRKLGLTKKEVRDIKAYDGKFDATAIKGFEEARGKEMIYLIIISQGRKECHDAGYPFLNILGRDRDGNFYDLGRHDHCLSYLPLNLDSYGKSVTRVMPWASSGKGWLIGNDFVPTSTFQIGRYGDSELIIF